MEAEKYLNIPNSNISSVCVKKNKTSHDFIFRYEKDGYIRGERLSLEELKIANSNISETLVGKYLPDGETLIKKYSKIKDAIEVENINKSCFYKILDSGVIYNGYIWKRIKNTYAEKFLTLYEKKRNTLKKILQYSKEGNFIQSYENIKEAQIQTGVKAKYIIESINGRHILAGNYIWREVSDGYIPNTIQTPNDKRIKKEIIQLSLQGEFIQKFESITQAANYFNISPSAISRCLRAKSSSCHNFHWKYA